MNKKPIFAEDLLAEIERQESLLHPCDRLEVENVKEIIRDFPASVGYPRGPSEEEQKAQLWTFIMRYGRALLVKGHERELYFNTLCADILRFTAKIIYE